MLVTVFKAMPTNSIVEGMKRQRVQAMEQKEIVIRKSRFMNFKKSMIGQRDKTKINETYFKRT